MTTFHYILWFALTIAFYALLQLADRFYRRKTAVWTHITAFILKLLLAVGLAFCCMALSIPIIWKTGYLTISIALFSDAWTDLFALIFRLIRKKAPGGKSMMVISLCLTIAYLTYGTVNMQIIRPKEHTYTSDKLTHEYTFVFLSDLHYGSAQSEQTVDNALAEIAELKPDFVLLGGDITDENTTAEEMQSLYRKLGALPAPVYYIYGNHDRQGKGDYVGGANYTPEELSAAIESNGITILQDKAVLFADDLTILGREDVNAGDSRCKVSADGFAILSADRLYAGVFRHDEGMRPCKAQLCDRFAVGRAEYPAQCAADLRHRLLPGNGHRGCGAGNRAGQSL